MDALNHRSPSAGEALARSLVEHGLSWGTADLVFAGDLHAVERAGELAASLTALTRSGESAFTAVVIVWPSHGGETPQITADIKAAFAATRSARSAPLLEASVIDAQFARVQLVRPPSLEMAALRATLEDVPAHSAVVIVNAARYREPTVVPTAVARPEDAWAPHLHNLLRHVMAVGAVRETYTVVDSGYELPPEGDSRALLFSVNGCGVFSAAATPFSLSHDLLTRWIDMAERGQFEAALRELNDIGELPELNALLVRVRLLDLGGRRAAAHAALDDARPTFAELSPTGALAVAQHAALVGAGELAVEILAPTIGTFEDANALESALRVADAVGSASLRRAVASRLTVLYPGSLELRRYKALRHIEGGEYTEAARLLREIADADGANADAVEDAAFWQMVAVLAPQSNEATGGDAVESFDPQAFLSAVVAAHPDRDHIARDLTVSILERKSRYADAVRLLLDAPHAADERAHDATCLALLRVMERSRLTRDTTIDDDLLVAALGRVIEALALRPRSEAVRSQLLYVLEPQLLGTRGLAALAVYLMRRLSNEGDVIAVPEPPPPTHAMEEMPPLFKKSLQSLSGQSVLALGEVRLSADVLTMPADDAVALYERMLRHQIERLAGNDGVDDLRTVLAIAMATALHGSVSDYDLIVLGDAASRIARGGRAQFARDLAESALQIAQDRPRRLRLAWGAYADVHHRLGGLSEALLAAACALAADDTVYSDQRRHESSLIFRLFRDLGLAELAEPLAERVAAEWDRVGGAGQGSVRHDTMRLQVAAAALGREGGRDPVKLASLISQVIGNVRDVLAVRDEVSPAALLLASLLRFAADDPLEIPTEADDVLRDAMQALREPMQHRIQLARASQPTVNDVVTFAARLDHARFADDVGFDLNELALHARRLLKPTTAGDATTAWYAVEAQSDLAITMPRVAVPPERGSADALVGDGTRATITDQRLIDTANGPITAARELATVDLSVVGLALAGDQLVRLTATPAGSSAPVVESDVQFLANRLREWGHEFPYGYGYAGNGNVFFTSTDGIGVSVLPERAVIVGSIALQGFPPNLLNVGDDFAGTSHRLAMAPSLTWLRAARRAPFESNGDRHAWIPTAERDEGIGTLATLADRLSEAFSEHAVTLHTGAALPDALARSELVIVAAHGGVADPNRYFLSVQDDVALRVPFGSVARSLAEIGVVVLFVCSGGRFDRRPGANAMLGLARELLNQGCRAVVAPPWPLETMVPPLWLPTFLAAWSAGHAVIDAVFEANKAVRGIGGAEPARYLAMTVYGDPLIRAHSRVAT